MHSGFGVYYVYHQELVPVNESMRVSSLGLKVCRVEAGIWAPLCSVA